MRANRTKGEVQFQVEDDPLVYTLLLDFNALCDLEEEVPGLMTGEANLTSPKAIRRVFHAGLSACHGDIDEREAGEIIHGLGLERAAEIIKEAFEASFPAKGGEEAARPQKASRKPGAGTGR